ncbi:MAG: transglutaminase domain-containing protein, partial [Halapricum sp.]
LSVNKPSGNVADAFLFEMNKGYCTYFATTMTVMLRTQGIPARMVVGYTPGERVSENKWVVRGYNSHAWVEAYFPDVGWVRFDPTPAASRQQAEQSRLQQARNDNESNVDTANSLNSTYTPPTFDGQNGGGPSSISPGDSENRTATNGTISTPTVGPDGSETQQSSGNAPGGGPKLPSRETLLLGAIAAFGLVASVRRTGASGRLYRAVWVRWQPRIDPETDVERAYERLEYLLEREYRPRRDGETPRQFLAAIDADERAREVAMIRERARYAGDVDEAAADRAVELVDTLVGEY